jgi:hypothetical protein
VSQPFASSNGSALQAQTRRSTRIEKSIPLIILGQNRQGEPFMERTVSVSLNKHGCRYSSRHDYGVGTWVTLQVVGLINSDEKPVRALVRSVHPAASSRELQQVGVELETPSNIWGVVQPPKDWLKEGEANSTIGPLAMPVRLPEEPTNMQEKASEVPPKPEPKKAEVANFPSPSPSASRNLGNKKKPEGSVPQRVVVTPEGLLSAIQGKLQQEAQKAVHAAVGKEISQAVQEALQSIESARQSSVQRIEESVSKNIESAATASKEEASAEIATQWKAELETYRGRTEEVTQRLEQQAAELRRELATAQQYVEKLTREIQPQIPGRLAEAVTHASKEFDSAAAVIMDRRYERLRESVQVATQEALLKLNARSAELQAQVQSTMNSSLEEFRRETELHANLTLAETKDRATSALSSLDAENSAACEARRQALETDLARFAERATDQFHKGMNAFLHSCLVAAVSAIDEHSANTVIGLMKESAKAIEESSSASQTAEESTTLPDTGGNNSQVH